MKKEYISEDGWRKILLFFLNSEGMYFKSEENLKKFIEGVLWLLRTGAQWRELPEKYGNWNSVFKRFNNWSKKDVWINFFHFCAEDPDLEYVSSDSTAVRAHPCAAGYGKQNEQGLGRSRGGFSSKIHALVESLGLPLKLLLTPGQQNDKTKAAELLEGITNAYVINDKAYDADEYRDQIKRQNCEACIPPRSNRKNLYDYDKHIYKERHVIECFFSKIKQFRRVFSRFDKSARNYLSFVNIAGALVWLR